MPERRIVFVLDKRELVRLVDDARAGRIASLEAYVDERTSTWTAARDVDGADVEILTLHPSWIDPRPKPVIVQ